MAKDLCLVLAHWSTKIIIGQSVGTLVYKQQIGKPTTFISELLESYEKL